MLSVNIEQKHTVIRSDQLDQDISKHIRDNIVDDLNNKVITNVYTHSYIVPESIEFMKDKFSPEKEYLTTKIELPNSSLSGDLVCTNTIRYFSISIELGTPTVMNITDKNPSFIICEDPYFVFQIPIQDQQTPDTVKYFNDKYVKRFQTMYRLNDNDKPIKVLKTKDITSLAIGQTIVVMPVNMRFNPINNKINCIGFIVDICHGHAMERYYHSVKDNNTYFNKDNIPELDSKSVDMDFLFPKYLLEMGELSKDNTDIDKTVVKYTKSKDYNLQYRSGVYSSNLPVLQLSNDPVKVTSGGACIIKSSAFDPSYYDMFAIIEFTSNYVYCKCKIH